MMFLEGTLRELYRAWQIYGAWTCREEHFKLLWNAFVAFEFKCKRLSE